MSDLDQNPVPKTYFGYGFRFSLLLHITLALWLVAHWVVQSVTPPSESEKKMLRPKKSIRVDVVDLPSLTMHELYKVDLTKEAAKNAPKPDEPAKELPPPPPNPKAMKLPDVLADKKEKKKPPEPEAKGTPKARLKELRESIRAEAKRQEIMAKYKKEAKGSDDDKRAVLGGNILSKGGSVQGDVANEQDEYTAALQSHVRKFWQAPPWAQGQLLKARVVVKLSPAGRVLSKKVVRSSGRPEFDASALEAVEAADPFPAPPEFVKRRALEEGIECGFPD